jgi:tetratricopeptide (TPR) repeat protein
MIRKERRILSNMVDWRNAAMYSVIVGDIVNSREIAPAAREKVSLAAKSLFERLNAEHIGSLMTTFGMVRGDAFEGVLLTQYHAPGIVQEIIKAFYRAEKTAVRISVVLGHLTVTGEDRNLTDGPAFHQAFEDLAKMKTSKSTHWLQVSFRIGSLAQKLVDGHLAMLAALTKGWTEKQREIVWEAEAFDGNTKLVSKKMGISQSVVAKQLNAADYGAYRMAWEGLADYLGKMDEYAVDEKPVTEKSYVPYFSLAMRKWEQYNFEEALQLFQISLELAKEELGNEDPLLIPIYIKMTRTCSFLKKYAEGEKAIQESLRLQESMPKARIQYIETLLAQADLKTAQGQYDTAEPFYQRILDIARNTLSKTNTVWRPIYNDIGVFYSRSGQKEKALEYYLAAKNSLNEGDNGPLEHAINCYNIAKSYYDLKNYNEANRYAEKALSALVENLPPGHERIIITQELIASIKEMAVE